MSTVESRVSGASAALMDLLREIVEPERILARPIDLIAHASDASFYRLIPRAVVQPRTIEEVRGLFRVSHQARIPLTFRGAGTSLSGQAISDGILVEVGRYWRQVGVEEDGKKVRVQPGVIGAHVNHALRRHHVKIGPDPASISTAMGIGPVPAVRAVLERAKLGIGDLDVIEVNEAFAAQALAVVRDLGLPEDRTNPNGSGISLGHPIGATGCILSVKALYELQRVDGRYALVTMCIGGGQGIAAIYERL